MLLRHIFSWHSSYIERICVVPSHWRVLRIHLSPFLSNFYISAITFEIKEWKPKITCVHIALVIPILKKCNFLHHDWTSLKSLKIMERSFNYPWILWSPCLCMYSFSVDQVDQVTPMASPLGSSPANTSLDFTPDSSNSRKWQSDFSLVHSLGMNIMRYFNIFVFCWRSKFPVCQTCNGYHEKTLLGGGGQNNILFLLQILPPLMIVLLWKLQDQHRQGTLPILWSSEYTRLRSFYILWHARSSHLLAM